MDDQKLVAYINSSVNEIVPEKEIIITLQTNFITLGLDSYDAMSFIGRLKEDFEDLPVTIFLQCQTTQDLIEYLKKNHEEELMKLDLK